MLYFVFTALLNSCVVQLEKKIIIDLAVEKASLQQLNCTVQKGSTIMLMKKQVIIKKRTYFLITIMHIMIDLTSKCVHPVVDTAAQVELFCHRRRCFLVKHDHDSKLFQSHPNPRSHLQS